MRKEGLMGEGGYSSVLGVGSVHLTLREGGGFVMDGPTSKTSACNMILEDYLALD